MSGHGSLPPAGFSMPEAWSVIAAAIALLSAAHMPVAGTLGLAAAGMAATTFWMWKALEIGFMRDFFAMIFRVFYRIEVKGLENLDPAVAGQNPIIAVNHISFLDCGDHSLDAAAPAGLRGR